MSGDVPVLNLAQVLTSNGIPDPTYDLEKWLIRSKQVGKRHPLDPLGVCLTCGDHKIGYWSWNSWEPAP